MGCCISQGSYVKREAGDSSELGQFKNDLIMGLLVKFWDGKRRPQNELFSLCVREVRGRGDYLHEKPETIAFFGGSGF